MKTRLICSDNQANLPGTGRIDVVADRQLERTGSFDSVVVEQL